MGGAFTNALVLRTDSAAVLIIPAILKRPGGPQTRGGSPKPPASAPRPGSKARKHDKSQDRNANCRFKVPIRPDCKQLYLLKLVSMNSNRPSSQHHSPVPVAPRANPQIPDHTTRSPNPHQSRPGAPQPPEKPGSCLANALDQNKRGKAGCMHEG